MLNTASAAFSHREGSAVARVAVQSREPRNTGREVTYLQLGSPARYTVSLLRVAALNYADKRLTILITYTHSDQLTHSSPARVTSLLLLLLLSPARALSTVVAFFLFFFSFAVSF